MSDGNGVESGAPDRPITVRQARADDHDAVTAFTEDTWPDREATDYLPRVFPEWVETDGPDQRTLVAVADGDCGDAGDGGAAGEGADDTVAGVCQGVLLSDHEAWAQGMRVDPRFRGAGIAAGLTDAVFDWAAAQGATVCRNLVFSWNADGLATSRGVGFDPVTEFRWGHPEPDADADPAGGADRETDDLTVTERPAAAWSHWQRSDASAALGGLALSPDETWALQELTVDSFRRVADETRVLAVLDGERTRAATFRARTSSPGEGDERIAEYGVASWTDAAAARALFGAIRRDAAAVDADRTRVLVPETPRHVSDAAHAGVPLAERPEFVLAADVSGRN